MRSKLELFKGFFIILFFLFIVVFLLSLLIPGRVVIVKSISIAAPLSEVVPAVQDLRNWQKWYPLFSDSGQPDNYAQFYKDSITWTQSKNQNKLTIVKRDSGMMIFGISTPGENEIDNVLSVLQDSSGVSSSIVQWNSVVHLGWLPWNKFAGIFTEKMSGPGYESALHALKDYIETSAR